MDGKRSLQKSSKESSKKYKNIEKLKKHSKSKAEKVNLLKESPALHDTKCSLKNIRKKGLDENWKQLIKQNPSLIKRKKDNQKKIDNKNSEGKSQTSSHIWFDNVDPIHLKSDEISEDEENGNLLVKNDAFKGLTKVIAMDCEMVGVEDDQSILARVSIVNQFGQCVYDKFVKPTETVIDYRTKFSGIRPSDLEKGEDFQKVQKEVSEILNKRILVGHAIHNDLKVLYLSHPRKDIRDTSRYKPFLTMFNGKTPSLKNLTHRVLGIEVQAGEHDSVQDAQAAMRLYTMHRKAWELKLKPKNKFSKLRNLKNGH